MAPLHDERWRWLRVRMRSDLYERFCELALEAEREPWDQARVILERAVRRRRKPDQPERAA